MKLTGHNFYRFYVMLLSCALLFNFPFYSTAQKDKHQNLKNENVNRSSLYFEENRGQFDSRVRYVCHVSGQTIFLTATDIVYVLQGAEQDAFASEPLDQTHKAELRQQRIVNRKQGSAVALYMRLIGAETNSPFEATDELEGRLNYFKGNNPDKWQTDVRTFSRVNYEGVYSDVDMSFYSNEQGEFEYDFIVKPNANHNQIALEIEGANDVRVKENGDLEIETQAGTITQRKPFTYQQTAENLKQEVSSQWSIVSGQDKEKDKNNPKSFTVKFEIGSYDRAKPLVIDPSVTLNNLSFSTLIGAAQNETGNDIDIDSAGNIYITGRTLSPLFPTTAGVFDPTTNGNEDIFITKLNASGTGLIFSTFLGGSFYDEGLGIAVDTNCNVYVSGSASSSFPTTVGSYDTTFNGGSDAFVTKLNATGTTLLYSTYIGASLNEFASDLTIDANNNVYIIGRTPDAVVDYPTTAGAFDTTHNGSDDVFVTKLNDTGTALVYSTFLGGNGIDSGTSIAVDSNQEAYVAGTTTDDVTDFPTTAGAFDTTHNGSTDFFVTKINSSGSGLVYSTFIGGPSIDNCNAIAIDGAGSAYVTGLINAGFPTTPGVVDTTATGSSEAGLSKLSADGSSLAYSTYIGGTQGETGRGVAVDAFGNAYVVGDTFSAGANDYPTTPGAYDTTFNGSGDVVLTVFNTGATAHLYSTFLGGSASEAGNDVVLDSSGNVYLTGNTTATATNFPTTPNAFQTTPVGGNDVIVCKFGDFVIAGRTVDANGAPIQNAAVSLSGNISEVKMTDVQGYFAFTDTEAGEDFVVAASRNGTTFNPSLFNIADLARNKQLAFIGTAGGPTGHPGGTLRIFPAEEINENATSVTLAVERFNVLNQNVVTIDYKTNSGTATANNDYTHRQGTITFLPFENVKMVEIPIINDNDLEQSETFTFTLSNPTGGAALSENIVSQITIQDDDAGNGNLLISEFRLGTKNDFVKLYNNTGKNMFVNSRDNSSGWTLAALSSDGLHLIPLFTLPRGTIIPAHSHFLIAKESFLTDVIQANANLVFFKTSNVENFNVSNVFDAVGFDNGFETPASIISIEGKGLRESKSTVHRFVRKTVDGIVQDTNNNAFDFILTAN